MTDDIRNTASLRAENQRHVKEADEELRQAYIRRAKMLQEVNTLDHTIRDITQSRLAAMTTLMLCAPDSGDRDFNFNAQTHTEVLEMVQESMSEAVKADDAPLAPLDDTSYTGDATNITVNLPAGVEDDE